VFSVFLRFGILEPFSLCGRGHAIEPSLEPEDSPLSGLVDGENSPCRTNAEIAGELRSLALALGPGDC